ncbi:MAG: hypothetical protein ACREK8_03270, partial [Gemmatimonadales bacterium]
SMHRPIPNPIRLLGLARILTGVWFILNGAATLRQYRDLVPQAQRLFGGDVGATDAPIRSLLALILAALLIPIGLGLVAMGFRWLRRLRLPPQGPAAIDRDEVVAALCRHELLSYAASHGEPYWPLRRWLSDELADLPDWRRAIVNRSVRIFVRSCAFAIALTIVLIVVQLTTGNLLGPFPLGFVAVLPFVTALGAVLALLLIASHSPRIESVEFSLPTRLGSHHGVQPEQIIESHPRLLHSESPAVGMTLGVIGVAVQCLMLLWWNLSYIGYPLLVTSIVRDAGSIAGGVVFFVLGHRMVTTAGELLLRFQYDSILVLIDDTGHGPAARAAAVRTESPGLAGPRRVVATVGGNYARESAERLIRESRVGD